MVKKRVFKKYLMKNKQKFECNLENCNKLDQKEVMFSYIEKIIAKVKKSGRGFMSHSLVDCFDDKV